MSLGRIFDAPATFFQQRQNSLPSLMERSQAVADIERVVVIGDSLAIGLGSVNIFDKNKNSTAYTTQRIENLQPSTLPGPVFPRMFAKTLSRRLNKPVRWRSAGVDGGAVPDIRNFCLGVIKEEVENNRPPDCVVIICGINDLKYFVSNPFSSDTPNDFRKNLLEMIMEIRSLCPSAKVVLPALPVQMIHKNSPLNVFPLSFFLDTLVGFWDSQKQLVAKIFPSHDVMYLGLTARDVKSWYPPIEEGEEDWNGSDNDEDDDGSLISADGVHPNGRCYARWAELMAGRLLATPVREPSMGKL